MSRRSAPTPARRRRAALAAAVLAACGLAAGGAALAQPTPGGVETVDARPPLPPDDSKPPLAAKYRVPEPARAMFVGTRDKSGVLQGGIEDERPLASEKQNPGEYAAWTEVVLHANQFPAAELEAHAGRNVLTPDDLTFPTRTAFRLDLLRFDGKLAKVRRVRPTKALEDDGLKEQFEARLVPADESPANPVTVVFTEYPAGLPAPPELPAGRPAGDWLAADRWVSFAGYFFKLMTYPGPGADPSTPTGAGWLKAPVLVGKSVTPLPGPPPEATAVPLDKSLRIFKLIRDDAPMAKVVERGWEEMAAWNRVVLHARKFSAAELEEAARDLSYASLFEPVRQDYKLELVKFTGRLIRVAKGETTPRLAEAGIAAWYEAWVVPDREPRGNPVCVVLTDLPPGVEPKVLMNARVTVAGYSFKLMHYESGEPQRDTPAKGVWRKAPLLIGHAATVLSGSDDDGGTAHWSTTFLPAIVGGVVFVAGSALVLSWWYYRGDRAARGEIDAVRQRNPFGDGAG